MGILIGPCPGVRVVFNGVRGSTPCAGPEYVRYGGNSSCVAVEADGSPPIVFDLGTGLRPYGSRNEGDFHGSVLLTHLHWDHVQGLPFFTPLHAKARPLDVYGPRQTEGPLGEVFTRMMQPPFFPIEPSQLAGDVRFHDTGDDDFPVGVAKMRSRWVRHVGPTLGFRVEWNGVSIAYVPDHGPGLQPRRPRRLRAARDARAVRRRRRVDPRRAAHARRVRAQAPLGSLHDRVRGARRAARVGVRASSCCSTTIPRTATTSSIAS